MTVKFVQVAGNTVFNWPDQQPMIVGIKEESDCYKNLVADNCINYCMDSDIVSKGEGTVVEKNLSENRGVLPKMREPIPFYKLWYSMGPFESDKQPRAVDFTREPLEEFLKKIKS